MSRVASRLRRAVPIYLGLLLVLAFLGATNQRLLARELDLMNERERARRELVELRAEAAAVQGPLAVSRWAQERGMVPAPEVEGTEHVMPSPAPELPEAREGLEVRTVWR